MIRSSLLPGNKMDSTGAMGNTLFYSVHQQKWVNIRQRSFWQCLGKILPREQKCYIECEIIPKGRIIILLLFLSHGCYFTTHVIKTKAGSIETKFSAMEIYKLPSTELYLWHWCMQVDPHRARLLAATCLFYTDFNGVVPTCTVVEQLWVRFPTKEDHMHLWVSVWTDGRIAGEALASLVKAKILLQYKGILPSKTHWHNLQWEERQVWPCWKHPQILLIPLCRQSPKQILIWII